jgi:hypothetical protein
MYHVSLKNIGNIVQMTPKVPSSRNPSECNVTKRVCCSPTIEGCLKGLDGIKDLSGSIANHQTVYLYQTNAKATPATEIFDFHRTQEHWITTLEDFFLVGAFKLINFEVVFE